MVSYDKGYALRVSTMNRGGLAVQSKHAMNDVQQGLHYTNCPTKNNVDILHTAVSRLHFAEAAALMAFLRCNKYSETMCTHNCRLTISYYAVRSTSAESHAPTCSKYFLNCMAFGFTTTK
eukprot:GHVQ01005131.1.p1 GENE.GHVQ01005131.1~~GHVQ01005131.1.p1  ORF type:complete len:120 (-),score=7.48 GHVQ01005131.1:271-630(-)